MKRIEILTIEQVVEFFKLAKDWTDEEKYEYLTSDPEDVYKEVV